MLTMFPLDYDTLANLYGEDTARAMTPESEHPDERDEITYPSDLIPKAIRDAYYDDDMLYDIDYNDCDDL